MKKRLSLGLIVCLFCIGVSFSVSAQTNAYNDKYCGVCGKELLERKGEDVDHWTSTHKAYLNVYVGDQQIWRWCTIYHTQKRDVKYCATHGEAGAVYYEVKTHSVTEPHPDN